MIDQIDAALKAEVLNQALPYIRQFQGQTFVVKYGGSAMTDSIAMRGVLRNLLLLQLVGIRPILVHGGGPEIDRWLDRLGMEKHTLRGLRVTDEATMDVVEMALAGKANKSLVAEIQALGGRAVGLSGRDGGLFLAEPLAEDLGRVGRIVRVAPEVVSTLSEAGFIPVVCSVAGDAEGKALNVNADTAAAELAGALGASKLILLSDTPGVLADKADPNSLISRLTASEATAMIDSGAADRGMIPKLQSAVLALEEGVRSVHLLNGGTLNAILIEVFTDSGIGTMLRREL